jgi:tetratricopeptide (TPR) repeat protein
LIQSTPARWLWPRSAILVQNWGSTEDRDEGVRLSKAALSANRDDPTTLRLAAHALAYIAGDLETARAEIERSLALNPNSAQAFGIKGWILVYSIEADNAISAFERAIRLSPLDPESYLFFSGLGLAHYTAGRFAESLEWGRKAVQENSHWAPGIRLLIVSLIALGRNQEAEQQAQRLRGILPNFSLRAAAEAMSTPMRQNEHFRTEFLNALRAVKEAAQRLGVRYVLEGSVRKGWRTSSHYRPAY